MKNGRGRHRGGTGRRRAVKVLIGVGIALVLISSGSAIAAYRYDKAAAGRILPGVKIAGVDVSGMTRDEAVGAVSGMVDSQLAKVLTVGSGKDTKRFAPAKLGVTADVSQAVDAALAVAGDFSWTERVFHRVWHRPVDRKVGLDYHADRERIAAFVEDAARQLNVSPNNAALDYVNGHLVLQKAKTGRTLKIKAARREVRALAEGTSDSAAFSFRTVKPEVGVKDLGKTIVVNVSTLQLTLYDGLKVEKTYAVATGQPAYPTPLGHFQIVNKRMNPTWVNGAKDSWGADLPDTIGPGPGNPLGTRALDLSAPGIRIHGTYASSSIGTHASHGCIRMHISDSEQLFDLVPVGTAVIIVS